MEPRIAPINRKSNETQIEGMLNIDGTGKTKVETPIGLLSHMLELFAFHGNFNLELEVKGDTHIDIHHTNEDIGIALGKAFKKALGENNLGIKRFGSAFAPMEDTLGHSVIDISGRGHLRSQVVGRVPVPSEEEGGYSLIHLEHFWDSFAKQLGANIIINVETPTSSTNVPDVHTVMETVFKSAGMALDQATTIDPRRTGKVPSTKGIID